MKLKKKRRWRLTPSVATPKAFEAISDDENPIVTTDKGTVTQKKARTKSKSPGRCHKSKSPNSKSVKPKNKKDNELEALLLSEAINQNKDILKTVKPKKKGLHLYLEYHPCPPQIKKNKNKNRVRNYDHKRKRTFYCCKPAD